MLKAVTDLPLPTQTFPLTVVLPPSVTFPLLAMFPCPLTPPPADAAGVLGHAGTTALSTDNGHTSWTESQTFHNGVTFVLTPNSKVPYTTGGVDYDVDVIVNKEGASAAATSWSRSFGLVVRFTCSRSGRVRWSSAWRSGSAIRSRA